VNLASVVFAGLALLCALLRWGGGLASRAFCVALRTIRRLAGALRDGVDGVVVKPRRLGVGVGHQTVRWAASAHIRRGKSVQPPAVAVAFKVDTNKHCNGTEHETWPSEIEIIE
jgi:hypothetical protein